MSPASEIDTGPSSPGRPKLRVEPDPPPVVRALVRDLAVRLADAEFAAATGDLRGTVSVRDAGTPQAATISLGDGAIAISHGPSEAATLAATVELANPGETLIADEADHPQLAAWLRVLLDRPPTDWPRAAEEFWTELAGMDGAPAALLVVELGSDEERRYGAPDGRACELHGGANGLADVLSGRVPVVDAAFAGTVFVRATFAELSLLAGAGFRVRYGGARGSGSDERANDG